MPEDRPTDPRQIISFFILKHKAQRNSHFWSITVGFLVFCASESADISALYKSSIITMYSNDSETDN